MTNQLTDSETKMLRELALKLVQKPPDPKQPGLVEAKKYVLLADAVEAFSELLLAAKEYAANLRVGARTPPILHGGDAANHGYQRGIQDRQETYSRDLRNSDWGDLFKGK